MAAKENKDKGTDKSEEAIDDALSNLSRAQYNEQMDCHQTLLQAKNAELTRLTEMLRSVRESKEPLAKVKVALQSEITEANKAINSKTEEVTLIKQKLRYHSVRQINENIERLEYQLRNNNYKPREEQKILNEISMLQRSKTTLREYEAKQVENKKYRAERARLIDERNNNFSKVKALYHQEDEIKKAMTELRGVISSSKKSIEQLRQMKPNLENKWVTQHHQQQAARSKRYEDKRRQRQELSKPRDRQESRRKAWEKYEATREPYEEECDMCRVLLIYLQSAMSSLGVATPATPATPTISRLTPTPISSPSTPASDPDYVGSFYMKPRDDDGFIRVSKREKAKAKKEHRLAKRVKELPHTPDVLLKFTKLAISPPKNTDEIPAGVIALQDALQHYHGLYMEAKKNNGKERVSESRNLNDNNFKCTRPTTLAINPPQLLVTMPDGDTPSSTSATPLHSESFSSPLSLSRSLAMATVSSPLQPETVSMSSERGIGLENTRMQINSNVGTPSGQCLENPNTPCESAVLSPTMSWAAIATRKHSNTEASSLLCEALVAQSTTKQEVVCNGESELSHFGVSAISDQREETKLCNGILPLGNNDSFFSTPISYTSNLVELNNNAARSYANVTAKMKVAALDY